MLHLLPLYVNKKQLKKLLLGRRSVNNKTASSCRKNKKEKAEGWRAASSCNNVHPHSFSVRCMVLVEVRFFNKLSDFSEMDSYSKNNHMWHCGWCNCSMIPLEIVLDRSMVELLDRVISAKPLQAEKGSETTIYAQLIHSIQVTIVVTKFIKFDL